MRILHHQRRRHSRAAASRCCEAIARALSDDVWVVAPETDQSGVSHSLSLNDPLRLREIGEQPFRRARARRPTASSWACARSCSTTPARSRPVRRQSRPQRRRGRHLFGHDRRRDRRHRCSAFRRSRCRRPIAARAAARSVLGHRASSTARTSSARCSTTASRADVLVNVNFPDCAPDEVKGIAVTTQGKRDQELLRIDAAPRRTRQSVFLDRLRARAAAAGATAPISRRSPTSAFRSRRCGST